MEYPKRRKERVWKKEKGKLSYDGVIIKENLERKHGNEIVDRRYE